MCGIVAYIGDRVASPILLNGLKRLEYRGYDSAGMALIEDGQIVFEKAAGKIRVLEEILEGKNGPPDSARSLIAALGRHSWREQ